MTRTIIELNKKDEQIYKWLILFFLIPLSVVFIELVRHTLLTILRIPSDQILFLYLFPTDPMPLGLAYVFLFVGVIFGSFFIYKTLDLILFGTIYSIESDELNFFLIRNGILKRRICIPKETIKKILINEENSNVDGMMLTSKKIFFVRKDGSKILILRRNKNQWSKMQDIKKILKAELEEDFI